MGIIIKSKRRKIVVGYTPRNWGFYVKWNVCCDVYSYRTTAVSRKILSTAALRQARRWRLTLIDLYLFINLQKYFPFMNYSLQLDKKKSSK